MGIVVDGVMMTPRWVRISKPADVAAVYALWSAYRTFARRVERSRTAERRDGYARIVGAIRRMGVGVFDVDFDYVRTVRDETSDANVTALVFYYR